MKKLVTILVFFACTSCKEDPQPTSFQGVVVYDDDRTRLITGSIGISEESKSKCIGCGANISDSRLISLDTTNGEFNVLFDANEDVIDYQIVIRDYSRTDLSIVFLEECGSILCNEIKPGKVYENLVIEVPRQ